jgi:hypothetical protein
MNQRKKSRAGNPKFSWWSKIKRKTRKSTLPISFGFKFEVLSFKFISSFQFPFPENERL